MSNLEPRVSTTMNSSTCSRQADFCCHAAIQSHSIILRSIKRCGYPGRHESCLSFRSHRFFPPFFCLFRLTTPRPRTRSASPVSYATPSSPLWLCSPSLCSLSLSPLVLSSLLPEFPAVMMEVLNIRGNPCTVSLSLSHLSFCSKLLFFYGAQINI